MKFLTFHDNIYLICSEIAKKNSVFHSLSKVFLSEQLKNVYEALMVPCITYDIGNWFGARQNFLNRVQVLQKKTIRATYNLQPDCSVRHSYPRKTYYGELLIA